MFRCFGVFRYFYEPPFILEFCKLPLKCEIVLENNKIHRFFSILLDLCDAPKITVGKWLDILKSEVRQGTPIHFTGSTGIYQYHNENILVLEIKCDLFPIRCFWGAESQLAKTIKNRLKVNEIESLKTEKIIIIIIISVLEPVFLYRGLGFLTSLPRRRPLHSERF